ncbi:MAG: nucleotidyltransferase domain-containing protein [Candidatus Diapherotrites archaeon]|nr:nucleotidyltransferase domain-containing protein [Candidatus Diapherotrites archaeon]
MERKAVQSVIRKFAQCLRKDFKDAKVILFGSRARNDALADSDYDVLVVSSQFGEMNFFERTEKMYAYWNERESLEALCYTPEEFREKSGRIGIVKEAIRTGIAL